MGAAAVPESQLVVDHTEVDDAGFVIVRTDDELGPREDLLSRIRSLERRAQSRDDEALLLDERKDAQARYLLRLESWALRNQAQVIRRQRADLLNGSPGSDNVPGASLQLGGMPTR